VRLGQTNGTNREAITQGSDTAADRRTAALEDIHAQYMER